MLRRHQLISFPGSIHFVTLVTKIRGNWFSSENVCRSILSSFDFCLKKTKVECYGYVLMPDHLHALLLESEHSEGVSKCIQDFKKFTSRKLKPSNYPDDNLWRIRFDDVPVPGIDAAMTKLNYIHDNPVRKEMVSRAQEYRWSSARFYVLEEPVDIEVHRIML